MHGNGNFSERKEIDMDNKDKLRHAWSTMGVSVTMVSAQHLRNISETKNDQNT